MAREVNISLFAGETREITTTVRDSDGNLVNLTDYDAELMVKSNKDMADNDAILLSEGVINNPSNGQITFNLTSADTAISPRKYYYDIKIIGAKTKFVNFGIFEVKQAVNRHE